MLINDWLPEWSPAHRGKRIWGLCLEGDMEFLVGGWDSALVKLACCGQLQCGLRNGPITLTLPAR